MDFIKCKLCRESFFSTGSRLCPACQEQVDNDFVTVRDYIYDHPQSSSVEKISQDTGVSDKIIIYLLEQDRLTAKGIIAATANLRCQVCGKPLESGTICDNCKAALTKELGTAGGESSKKAGPSTYISPRSSRIDE